MMVQVYADLSPGSTCKPLVQMPCEGMGLAVVKPGQMVSGAAGEPDLKHRWAWAASPFPEAPLL